MLAVRTSASFVREISTFFEAGYEGGSKASKYRSKYPKGCIGECYHDEEDWKIRRL